MKIAVNRVLLAFKSWEERKKEMDPLIKAGSTDERTAAGLQLDHLRKASHRLGESARPDERPFMALLDNHIGRLEKQLYPNLLVRLFSQLKDRFFDGPAYLQQQAQQRSANMESLKNQLQTAGLGGIAGKLEKHLDAEQPSVCLPVDCQLGPDKRLNYDLHFEKDVFGNFQLDRLDGNLLENGKTVRSHELNWPNGQTSKAIRYGACWKAVPLSRNTLTSRVTQISAGQNSAQTECNSMTGNILMT
jgi:hypothetical protein